jgi:hypothetical protein
MKSRDLSLEEFDYLPTHLFESFAKSYALSFPELNLDPQALLSFLNRKFVTLQNNGFHNIAALATTDGVIASGYGILRNKYTQGELSFDVGLVCDVFTKADFRKMGLFKRVSIHAIKREEMTDTKFLIGFPIREEVMPGHLSVGWRYIFDMPLWWALPRLGSIRNVKKNPTLRSTLFTIEPNAIAIKPTDEYLNWRFSLFDVNYYLVTIPNSEDFAIVRKSKLRKLSFTCIVFMQSTSKNHTNKIISEIRSLSLRLGTLGVIGCWNDSYARDLFVPTSGLRKSSKIQKVIIRELNGFTCPNEENGYRLSWMDSDTL